jgi:MtN3 and saliva related transmembrane protein
VLADERDRVMESVTIVGSIASLFSVASFVPQAWKIIRTRETRAISGAMYALTVTGFALWLCYGVLLDAWPIVATNAICFVLSAFVLIMKLLSPSARKIVADTLDPKSP